AGRASRWSRTPTRRRPRARGRSGRERTEIGAACERMELARKRERVGSRLARKRERVGSRLARKRERVGSPAARKRERVESTRGRNGHDLVLDLRREVCKILSFRALFREHGNVRKSR